MAKKKANTTVLGKKILLAVLIVAAVIGLSYLTYYLIHFTFYDDYKQYIGGEYTYETGTELTLGEALPGHSKYKLVTQTDVLGLYLEESTSDIAVYDKRSGEITFGIPENVEDDPIAKTDAQKNYLKSHLLVTYYNTNRAQGTYDSYSMSVAKEQVTYQAIEGGVRVIYDLGDYGDASGTVPMYLTYAKFDEICAQLDEKDAQQFGRWYLETSDVSGMRQLIKTARTNRMTKKKIQAILDSVGFTTEDYEEQMAISGNAVTAPLSFTVAVEYRLEGDHLNVSVPVSAIEERGGGSIYSIQLLRNFGAADGSAEGYLVVPNGDGSLIYFNNGKTNAAEYRQYIYGIDPLAADYIVLENANNAAMALFGIQKENSTVLATVEDGASLATITAGVAGRVNNYNYAYTTFMIRGNEKLEMFGTTGNEAALPIVEDKPYDCNLTVRYSFLDEEHTGYSGMANYYRQRLIDEGVLKLQEAGEELKFYYDVIAGVELTEYFLGKQYMGLTAMTTFEEAQQISDTLKAAGISNQVMNLQGWFNGGYYHDAANHIFVTGKLGGKSGLEELSAAVAKNGGTMYADVAFQKVSYESEGIWYNYQAENSKYYGSGYVASFGQVSPVTLRQTSSLGYVETMYNLVSPKFLVRYVETFSDKIEKYDISGISLRDLGSTLQSDKRRTNLINREQALDIVRSMLKEIDGTGKSLLINQPNDYSWSVANDLLNLPLADNDYPIIDEQIPLYEMIVHGCIDYCGSVYNLSNTGDTRKLVLTMVEYGAAPHFVFTWEETTEMKYSGLNSCYSTTFSTWKDTAISVYDEVSGVLDQVSGATVVSHEILDGNVRAVRYSNGITVYVNYSAQDVTVEGVTVPATGYAVK